MISIASNGSTDRLLTEIRAIAAGTEQLASKISKGEFVDYCACGRETSSAPGMCAWHAQIADQLQTARNILGYAMQSVKKGR